MCTSEFIIADVSVRSPAVLLFSKLNKIFFGYFDPDFFFFKIMKINNFQREITGISAKKGALVTRKLMYLNRVKNA